MALWHCCLDIRVAACTLRQKPYMCATDVPRIVCRMKHGITQQHAMQNVQQNLERSSRRPVTVLQDNRFAVHPIHVITHLLYATYIKYCRLVQHSIVSPPSPTPIPSVEIDTCCTKLTFHFLHFTRLPSKTRRTSSTTPPKTTPINTTHHR